MSIPPDSPWRGCASSFPQPVNDEHAAQYFVETIYYFNCRDESAPSGRLADIVYRDGGGEYDILNHVFRWDITAYEQVLENGFEARRQEGIPDNVYYNLDHHVHHGGRPLDSNRPTTHVFVSTTLSSGWRPNLNPGTVQEVYRYEIYAPGGILVSETLNRYDHENQEEVAFVAGIAPQYIRSAQLFRLIGGIGFTSMERVNNIIIVNGNFNPQQHPPSLLRIRNPVSYYYQVTEDGRRRRVSLSVSTYRPQPPVDPQRERQKREVSTDSDGITHWYAISVANIETYIDAAFRSSKDNEVYVFMKNECVLVNYAPGSKDNKPIDGPRLICDVFPFLADTAFAEYGIDCAFRSYDREEAFIFSGNLCAQLNYAPGTTKGKIIKGPTTIAKMFPFLKGTAFESGVDAAFDLSRGYEAYLFKGGQYARIDYGFENSQLIGAIRHISEGFPSLRGTIFESGIGAAFTSHKYDGWLSKAYYEVEDAGISEGDSSSAPINFVPVAQDEPDEAYIFKEDSYALISFVPDIGNDYVVEQVKPILSGWPSLRGILPRKNVGLDVHDHAATPQAHDAPTSTPPAHPPHDELKK